MGWREIIKIRRKRKKKSIRKKIKKESLKSYVILNHFI